MKTATQVLNNRQVEQRINRIAFQIYEDNFNEKELYIAGIARSGFVFAKRLQQALNNICSLKTTLVEVTLDKENPIDHTLNPALSQKDLNGKVIIVADDVLNSGKTLIYSLRAFLDADIKKIRTALLVDRDHKRYPVEADYVGITLSTTLQEHITVDLTPGKESVTLQ
jgi:pyrimidine operon attenuation protein / uracil phosphoribosyltransferase